MPPKRITIKQMYYDFQSRIYGFDGMFPRTIHDLTLRPGRVADAYIQGNRTAYYGPVGYFFLMGTVMYLLSDLLGIDLVAFMKGMNQSYQNFSENQEKMVSELYASISNNLKLFTFLQIPILGLLSRYVFFRKTGYNYLEYTVLPLYVHGHLFWLTIVMLIAFKFGVPNFPLIVSFISLLYIAYAYMTWMNRQPAVKTFIKGLALYVLSLIIFVFLFSAVFLSVFLLSKK